jgi:hypothetical protein
LPTLLSVIIYVLGYIETTFVTVLVANSYSGYNMMYEVGKPWLHLQLLVQHIFLATIRGGGGGGQYTTPVVISSLFLFDYCFY